MNSARIKPGIDGGGMIIARSLHGETKTISTNLDRLTDTLFSVAQLMAAIFDFRHTQLSDCIPTGLSVLPEPENMAYPLEFRCHHVFL